MQKKGKKKKSSDFRENTVCGYWITNLAPPSPTFRESILSLKYEYWPQIRALFFKRSELRNELRKFWRLPDHSSKYLIWHILKSLFGAFLSMIWLEFSRYREKIFQNANNQTFRNSHAAIWVQAFGHKTYYYSITGLGLTFPQ